MYSEKKQASLLNGTVIESNDGKFPPLQDVVKVYDACTICPIRPLCQDNNEFDCQVYGMFSGFYMGVDDALNFVDPNTIWVPPIKVEHNSTPSKLILADETVNSERYAYCRLWR